MNNKNYIYTHDMIKGELEIIGIGDNKSRVTLIGDEIPVGIAFMSRAEVYQWIYDTHKDILNVHGLLN